MSDGKHPIIGGIVVILIMSAISYGIGHLPSKDVEQSDPRSIMDEDIEANYNSDQEYLEDHEAEEEYYDSMEEYAEQGIYPVTAAKDYIGEYATFVGKVTEVTQPGANGDPIFVNLGGSYPDATLTGVCWDEYHSNFGDLEQYEGKDVIIEGTVYDYNGTPNIELTDSFQIREQ